MIDPVSCAMRAATRKPGEPLRVVTAVTHERASSIWASINAHFYLVSGFQGFKAKWDERYAPMPANFTALPPCRDGRFDLPADVVPDLFIAQHRFGQFQAFKPVADMLGIPLMVIEHTLPRPEWTREDLAGIKRMRGDSNYFITAESRGSWGWTPAEAGVIEHGIDTDLFSPPPAGTVRHIAVVTVANDFRNRGDILGFDIWEQATRDMPRRPIGDTPGLSEAAPSVEALAAELAAGSVFLCPARSSPIPMSLLESMSCGLACVAIRQSAVASVIEHGMNGLLADDAVGIRHHLMAVRSDGALRHRLGQAARQTILDRFPLEHSRSEWSRAMFGTADGVHTP